MNCPNCGSINVVKKGSDRHNRQRYQCKDCHKNFGDRQKVTPKTTGDYTKGKSFSLSVDAITALEKASSLTGKSQSKIINNLILEHLND